MFKDVQNVLLQHKPMLHNVVDGIVKNKLPVTEFPIIAGGLNQQTQATPNVIVFVVGGATYEEAKEIAVNYNSTNEPAG
jgi:hypothetical protein